MFRLAAALAVSLVSAVLPAHAEDGAGPVVVELFTSQGCSSCPPADAVLAELAPRDDVIALALHVDYWNYLGWRDSFSQPGFTKRQKDYARAIGSRSIYTPQMIVAGQDHLTGLKPMKLADRIRAHAAQGARVRLDLRRDGDRVEILAVAEPPLQRPAIVQLVRYTPEAAVDILRGENAGRRMVYSNIVTSWQALEDWDGRAPLRLRAPAAGDEPVVVIVQDRRPGGPGAILAAARLR